MKRLLVFIDMPMLCPSPASGDELDEGLPRERVRADEEQRPGRDPTKGRGHRPDARGLLPIDSVSSHRVHSREKSIRGILVTARNRKADRDTERVPGRPFCRQTPAGWPTASSRGKIPHPDSWRTRVRTSGRGVHNRARAGRREGGSRVSAEVDRFPKISPALPLLRTPFFPVKGPALSGMLLHS